MPAVHLTLDDALAADPRGGTSDDTVDGPADSHSQPLRDTTFVVVDLETTGTLTEGAGITEIGAVMVRGGEVVGEFRTFVNPGVPIPPFIAVLTGITDAHVADAPGIEAALPAFLEFAGFGGAEPQARVLVAHNAPFDVGFLKAACVATGTTWPKPPIVDTVTVARRVLRGGEVPNRKLGTLAAYFAAATTPSHRALDDARATVDVLHGLIARIGNLGVHDLASLLAFDGQATESRRRKRHLADGLPDGPGVYVFRDVRDRPLYVGVSVNVRTRVKSYFTASETRRAMTAMVELAQSVTAVRCHTPLEARVRELRLINEHRPRFNRRSTRPEETAWLALTTDRHPRLSIVRHANLTDARRVTIGPFPSTSAARLAMDALHEVFPVRQCTSRITTARSGPACILADMGRCCAPCVSTDVDAEYAQTVTDVGAAMLGAGGLASPLEARMAALAADFRFEDAAVLRDRLLSVTRAVSRAAELRSLQAIPQITAAAPRRGGGWDIHVIRHGWLAASGWCDTADGVLATAAAVEATAATHPGGTTLVSESEAIVGWLRSTGARLVQLTPGYAWHVPAAARPYSAARAVDTRAS